MSGSRRPLLAVLFLLVGTSIAGAAPDGRRFSDLDARDQQELAEAARAYLDPDLEFTYAARRHFEERLQSSAAGGVDALGDVTFLRDVAYQGRHFLSRFTDPSWAKSAGRNVTNTEGTYENVESKRLRFAFSTPTEYPAGAALYEKVPRVAPYPLLIALHDRTDERSGLGNRVKFVGEAVMKRRYPKNVFAALYQTWFTLAPIAPGARFVVDGRLDPKFFTLPLREFWKRYHVDFDRIVLDGTEAAACAAANFPYAFAGLVLRGGVVDAEMARNLAGVPVYVVEDEKLADELAEAGHPDVTEGDAAALWPWIEKRKRRIPRSFAWSVYDDDAVRANWIAVRVYDARVRAGFRVEVVDTETAPNTIRLTSQGVHEVDLFLNDDVVDLDRPVRVVANGHVLVERRLEREFDQLWDRDPEVRENMYFGWLHPVRLSGLELRPPEPSLPLADDPRAEGDPEDEAKIRRLEGLGDLLQLTPSDRLDVQYAFLMGRLDRVETLLAGADGPDALYPLALIDLWWRRTRDEESVRHWEHVAERAVETPLLGRRYRWLLGGGDGPYPTEDAVDTWPVLTSLVLDRIYREEMGRSGLPARSPLALRPPPDAWADWYGDWKDSFLDWTMRHAYLGADRTRLSDEERDAAQDADLRATGARLRNGLLALVAILLFVGGALAVGRAAGRASKAGSRS